MAQSVKLGFFGLRNRELTLIAAANLHDRGVKVTACFDKKHPDLVAKFSELFPSAAVYGCPEEFMESGINAVVLGDCAKGTEDPAIKFMKKGIAVLAGSMPASCIEGALKLLAAKEETGAKYMFGTPIVYSPEIADIRKTYADKSLGQVIFAEGEFLSDGADVCPGYPAVFYGTRALLPLLSVTGEKPVRLIARESFNHIGKDLKGPDSIPQIFIETENGAVLRIAGSANVYPRGRWYRFGTVHGGIETKRGENENVIVGYTSNKPADFKGEKETYEYTAAYDSATRRKYKDLSNAEIAEILMLKHFIAFVRGEEEAEYGAYEAAIVTSVLMLGCRSAYNDGVSYKVPDFTVGAEREMYRRDRFTPIKDENGFVSLPCKAMPVR